MHSSWDKALKYRCESDMTLDILKIPYKFVYSPFE